MLYLSTHTFLWNRLLGACLLSRWIFVALFIILFIVYRSSWHVNVRVGTFFSFSIFYFFCKLTAWYLVIFAMAACPQQNHMCLKKFFLKFWLV